MLRTQQSFGGERKGGDAGQHEVERALVWEGHDVELGAFALDCVREWGWQAGQAALAGG
jgi:hypothetical protein